MKQSEAERIGLSRLVAEHVMGLDPICCGPLRAVIQQGNDPQYRHYYCQVCGTKITLAPNYTGLPESHRRNCPDYEHDMNAAMQVVESEKFRSFKVEKIWVVPTALPKYHCNISVNDPTMFCLTFDAKAETAQKAVCLAALKACGVIDE